MSVETLANARSYFTARSEALHGTIGYSDGNSVWGGFTSPLFWGADIDGVKGRVRASVVRSISLVWITVQILKLGFTSIPLLQVLCGGFVSLNWSFPNHQSSGWSCYFQEG